MRRTLNARHKMNIVKSMPIILLAICQTAGAAELADTREPLIATAIEKSYILEQMRLFTASIQMIADGLAIGNDGAVAEAAVARGARQNAGDPNFPASLSAKLPPLWKQMGMGLRGGFDEIADAAKHGAPKEKTLATLANAMRNCVACHQTYKIVEKDHE
jgi:hypothetical protein